MWGSMLPVQTEPAWDSFCPFCVCTLSLKINKINFKKMKGDIILLYLIVNWSSPLSNLVGEKIQKNSEKSFIIYLNKETKNDRDT